MHSNLAETTDGHDPDPPPAGPTDAGDGIDLGSAELAALDQDCRTGFARLIDQLGDIRASGLDLQQRLTGLAEFAATDRSGGRTDQLSDAVGAALDTFRTASGFERSRDAQATNTAADQSLRLIRQRGTYLWSVSSIINSTAAALHLDRFGAYADELHLISQDLIRNADAVLDKFRGVAGREGASIRSISLALPALMQLAGRLRGLSAEIARLDRQEAAAGVELSGAAEALNRDLQAEIVGLVALIQFADQMAQRLDHIGQIQAMGPECGRVVGAQLDGLHEDVEATLGEARQRLARLEGMTGSAAAQLEASGFAGAIARSAAARRDTLNATLKDSEPVERAATEANRNSAFLHKALGEVEEAFAALIHSNQDISQASINSMILAARVGGDNQSAFTNLAVAVKQAANECMDAITSGRAALDGAKASNETHNRALVEVSDGLAQALQAARDTLASSEADQQALTELCQSGTGDATALAEAIGLAETSVAGLAQLLPLIRHLIAATDDSIDPPERRLAEIRGIYTMAREREIHDRLAPEGPQGADGAAPPETAPPAAENDDGDDDLDDILF